MPLAMAGINHIGYQPGSPPRWVPPRRLRPLLMKLPFLWSASLEAVILSTCARLELYTVAERGTAAARFQALLGQLQLRGSGAETLQIEERYECDVVEHLLRIAGGLDPQYVGEPYALRKIRDALNLAQECGVAGPVLTQLFAHAVQTGLRVQTATPLGNRTAFLCQAALQTLSHRHAALVGGNLLIVGASEAANLAAQALSEGNAFSIATINRTDTAQHAMQRQVPGPAFPWHQMRTAISWADVVLVADAALHPILDAGDVAAAFALRHRQNLLLIDLGQPPNVHPSVIGMENIICYDWSDMQSLLIHLAQQTIREQSQEAWVQALPLAEEIVRKETQLCWHGLKPAYL